MNFFEKQRNALPGKPSQRAMATRIGVSNEAVRRWESDEVIPATPVAILATAYEVSEKVIERELMALRRRIEARELSASTK